MNFILIVMFGAGLFGLVVMFLMPAAVGAIAGSRDSQTRARPHAVLEALAACPAAPAEKGAWGLSLVPLPCRPLDLRLPQLPEPHLRHHFTIASALPFPGSIVSPVRSPESGAMIKGLIV